MGGPDGRSWCAVVKGSFDRAGRLVYKAAPFLPA